LFSAVSAEGKSAYFRCLLVLDMLWVKGVLEMLSNQSQSYYECLLEGKVVLPHHPAALYTAILRGEEEVAKGMVPPAARARRAPEP
jgi:hypothetical protein